VSSQVGRLSRLDASTRARIEAGCHFINAEIARHRRRVIWWTTAAFGAALVVWIVSRIPTPVPFAFGAFVVALIAYSASQHSLAESFKGVVVRRIVEALGGGLTYQPDSSLTKEEFLEMDLFDRLVEQWNSEDEIGGRKGEVSYALHECTATRTEGSGKSRRTVTIFRGLIIRLDFNKHFTGHSVVVPNAESQILGGLFGEAESRRKKTLARMENPEFESIYSVYSTDDQQARYILTPKVMELIVGAQRRLDAELRLAFFDNSVFVTVPRRENRFEVALFGAPVTPESVVGDIAELVQLAEQLVDALDLETRIWTR
jgi:hypothetical protein